MPTHRQTVLDQFDPQAAAYLNSSVHAEGPDLLHARDLVARELARTAQGLDVGCGAGHLSHVLARVLGRVVALDPSPAMLLAVDGGAAASPDTPVQTCQGQAGALPFTNALFDLVATRYSAHHWTLLAPGLMEMRRVVRPQGYALIIDVEGSDDALVDTHLQAIELLRDRSHVRNRTNEQWQSLLQASGFEVLEYKAWATRLEFSSWVARMRTPANAVAMIRELQQRAPVEVQRALSLEDDGSFSVRTGLWWARAR